MIGRANAGTTAFLLAGIAFCLPAFADGQERSWSTVVTEAGAFAADCTDCGADIGMLVACTQAGGPLAVAVQGAAASEGEDGAVAPIAFSVYGRTRYYTATVWRYGELGYVPEVIVGLRDPLIHALGRGRKVMVAFGDTHTTLSLNGSLVALRQLAASC
jgi:hypothetical protein